MKKGKKRTSFFFGQVFLLNREIRYLRGQALAIACLHPPLHRNNDGTTLPSLALGMTSGFLSQ
jgi:hypothetical protein